LSLLFLGEKPGFEYNFALIGMLSAILIAGPGRFALAHVLPLPRRGHDREALGALQ
jgi:hypothetical protein